MKSIAWIFSVYEEQFLYIVPMTEENSGIIEKIRFVSNIAVNAEEYTAEQVGVLKSLEHELRNSEEFRSYFGEFTDANISEIHLTSWYE